MIHSRRFKVEITIMASRIFPLPEPPPYGEFE
jgi:hypothetical protein